MANTCLYLHETIDILGTGSEAYLWWPNPWDVERSPDGLAAGYPLGGWIGASFAGDNTYAVALTGVRFSVSPPVIGDVNCDGVVNFDDINAFVLALVGQASYEAAYPNCRWLNADIDGNSIVNFDDINPFVNCLVSAGCP